MWKVKQEHIHLFIILTPNYYCQDTNIAVFLLHPVPLTLMASATPPLLLPPMQAALDTHFDLISIPSGQTCWEEGNGGKAHSVLTLGLDLGPWVPATGWSCGEGDKESTSSNPDTEARATCKHFLSIYNFPVSIHCTSSWGALEGSAVGYRIAYVFLSTCGASLPCLSSDEVSLLPLLSLPPCPSPKLLSFLTLRDQ